MLGIHAGQTLSPQLFFIGIIVGYTRHDTLISFHAAIQLISVSKATHTRSSAGTSAKPFTVSGQGITSSKFAVALGAYMGFFARVELAVTF
jgi:hypothetical protein